MSKTSSKASNISLPTVISTAIILNAVVRASAEAATLLGSDYHSVVRKDMFNSTVSVYKNAPPLTIDPLDTSQAVAARETPIWSMTLSESDLENQKPIFPEETLRYFFLSQHEALAYLGKVEAATIKIILKFAENSKKEIK